MNSPADSREAAIIRSWHANAKPWSEAIRTRSIVSRRVTDGAILDAVVQLEPRRVLDLGCGEGWLSRALVGREIAAVGFDVVPELIAEARERGGGEFHVRDYRDIAQDPQTPGGERLRGVFDAIVCNFSLFGDESTESLLRALPFYLGVPGYLIVQTLHPAAVCGGEPYRDGWRAGSWSGFSPAFRDPPPWYFRTLASWFAILRRCGFALLEYREPTGTDAVAPASVIFICIKEG